MKAIFILCGVVLAIFLLLQLRIGAMAEFSEGGFLVRARIGGFWISIFPSKKKPLKKKDQKTDRKKRKKEKKAPEEEPQKHGGSLSLVQKILPLVAETAGRLRQKIRVDKLSLDFTAAAGDPAGAAMAFGISNVAIGMLWPVLAHNFNIKEQQIRTAVDFNAKEPVVYLLVSGSLTIGQGVMLSLYLLIHILKLFSRREMA